MTAEGHLFFSISCAILAKNIELTPILAQGDWWHIISSTMLTCLLPDIDHPKSFLGQRFKCISKPIARACGHRGFTHSLLATLILLILLYSKVLEIWTISEDVIQGMVLGYISHIFADMLTPAGVPLAWPCRLRFCLPILVEQKNNQFERTLCITLLAYTFWTSQDLSKNSITIWLLQIINLLRCQFNQFC